ncbi:hypothetical protein J6590_060493 [Homalodisca vitripennis]|nr:hypothetical protein J6590_060493 [Homalodisca vitripennis]
MSKAAPRDRESVSGRVHQPRSLSRADTDGSLAAALLRVVHTVRQVSTLALGLGARVLCPGDKLPHIHSLTTPIVCLERWLSRQRISIQSWLYLA